MTNEQRNEQMWIRGNRAAWTAMLGECLRNLDPLGGSSEMSSERARWIKEREDAIVVLRRLCDTHGDNTWDEDFYLADVIEYHLEKHLES